MTVSILTLLLALPCAMAWPGVAELDSTIQRRDVEPPARQPLFNSGRTNLGFAGVALGFDADEQYVDVSEGSGHEFQPPTAEDLRGQCPGLNAAANHNYLPRNGIASVEQTITGLGAAFGMGPDFSLVLSIVAIALSGDIPTLRWSIGGAFPASLPLLGTPKGILGTHIKYESDASIVRGDAYLNGGNPGIFQMRSWERLYSLAEEYTMEHMADQSDYQTRWSILNNPYYFSGPFSAIVGPAAHNFVVNFMSNHSVEAPNGVLNRDVLKQFFAVTGEPGNFTHSPGQERIPDNWYRRSSANPYGLNPGGLDVQVNNLMYPGIFRIGGNTGTTDSFAGVDLQHLTNGVFNVADLAEGNNAACYMLRASMAAIPDEANPLLGVVGSVLGFVTQQLGPLTQELGCPELASFNNSLFDKFPGYSYKAMGQ